MPAKNLHQTDAKHAAHLFAQWAQLICVLAENAKFHLDSKRSTVQCSVKLPGKETLNVSAESAEAVALKMMSALNSKVLGAHGETGWNTEYQKIIDAGNKPTEAVMHTESLQRANKPGRTKERQDTIGVSSKKALHAAVSDLADIRGESVASIARELVADGFESFEKRSRNESPTKLLINYESTLSTIDGDETVQWMVRLNRHLSIKLKLTAKEYGKSSSQLVAMCLADSLARQNQLAPSTATTEELVSARAAVAAIKGRRVRELSDAVGIGDGEEVSLMMEVLSGTLRAPLKLLDAISKVLCVPSVALKQVFAESFERSAVPAFKSEDGKPYVPLQPQEWKDAVRALALSDAKTSRLLKFND